MTTPRPSIALWFRYGPAEHAELFHAMPAVVEALAREADVHYFGMRTSKPVPPAIQQHATLHLLPVSVNRGSGADKLFKTFLWLLAIPWMSRTCRRLGVGAVYMDETIPLTAPLARACFGPNVAITVADFFVDIYFRGPLLRGLGTLVRRIDLAAWRRLPLVFTRAVNTRDFLAAHGVPPERVRPVYDPCDFAVYRPIPRAEPRARFGYGPEHVVLVHHGILHPNKGNDRILRALAEIRDHCPGLRYLLVGDGPDMRRLRALTAELGIGDRVRFTGWLPRLEQVNEALNAGDIGLVMRIGRQSDNFHMTGALVHSMACGLPILAARLAGVSEAVEEGRSGLLFDPENMDEFKARLIELAGQPSLRTTLGAQALARAHELFDMDKVTRQTVEPLLEMLKRRMKPET
jgi:glycosyltransferase involved in cell wall biosynthesis